MTHQPTSRPEALPPATLPLAEAGFSLPTLDLGPAYNTPLDEDSQPAREKPSGGPTDKPTRRPRFQRVDSTTLPLRISDEDRQVFQLLFDHGVLTAELLQLLLGRPSRWFLNRLQRLYHHGYVDRRKLDNNAPILYLLGDRGAQELAHYSGEDTAAIDWQRRNRERTISHLDHRLMVGRFRAVLTAALRTKPDIQLEVWQREGKDLKDEVFFQEDRHSPGGEITRVEVRAPVNPDAFLTLNRQGKRALFYLEADRGTVTNNVRFALKLKGYWHYWQQGGFKKKFGVENFRVLTLTLSAPRRDNLQGVAKRIAAEVDDPMTGNMFLFGSEQDVAVRNPATILGHIWRTPADDAAHTLLE